MGKRLTGAPAFIRSHIAGNARKVNVRSFIWTRGKPTRLKVGITNVSAGAFVSVSSSVPSVVAVTSPAINQYYLTQGVPGSTDITIQVMYGLTPYVQTITITVT